MTPDEAFQAMVALTGELGLYDDDLFPDAYHGYPEAPGNSQFEHDTALLGWRAAMGLWLENRTGAPKIIGWTEPERRQSPP